MIRPCSSVRPDLISTELSSRDRDTCCEMRWCLTLARAQRKHDMPIIAISRIARRLGTGRCSRCRAPRRWHAFVACAIAGVGASALSATSGATGPAPQDQHQFREQHDLDQRAGMGSILQEALAQLDEVDVEHHDDRTGTARRRRRQILFLTRIIAMNSAPISTNRPAALKNARIRNSTEWDRVAGRNDHYARGHGHHGKDVECDRRNDHAASCW